MSACAAWRSLHAIAQLNEIISIACEHRVQAGLTIDARSQRARDRERHDLLLRAGRAGGAGIVAAVAGVHRDHDIAFALGRRCVRGAHAAQRGRRCRRCRRCRRRGQRRGSHGAARSRGQQRRRRRARGRDQRDAKLIAVGTCQALHLRAHRRAQLGYQPQRAPVGHPGAQSRDHAALGRLRQPDPAPRVGQVDHQPVGVAQTKHVLGDRRGQRQRQHRALRIRLERNLLELSGQAWAGGGHRHQRQAPRPGRRCRYTSDRDRICGSRQTSPLIPAGLTLC